MSAPRGSKAEIRSEGRLLWSLARCARALDLTYEGFRSLIRREGLPVVRLRRRVFVARETLEQWIRDSAQPLGNSVGRPGPEAIPSHTEPGGGQGESVSMR